MNIISSFKRLGPGIALCALVTVASWAVSALEHRLVGRVLIEPLILAILLGVVVRLVWRPGGVWSPGVGFSAKILLEVAVALLGASVTLSALEAAGPKLIVGIAAAVALSLSVSFAVSRLLQIPTRTSVLIACGNSICGNSAIVSVAPVIGADIDEIASSIAFTALLGVIAVLSLPMVIPLLGLSYSQYGVLAGLTVYAVPQVLATTIPVSAVSAQVGMLVKLVRVLMLGPVILLLTLGRATLLGTTCKDSAVVLRWYSPNVLLERIIPWFILGFALMATLRAMDFLPSQVLIVANGASDVLTIISMAALGLLVDIRAVFRASLRQLAAVSVSLAILLLISLGLIYLLGVS